MKNEFLCVLCPNGCDIEALYTDDKPSVMLSCSGQGCPKGCEWVRQEIETPVRILCTSVLVIGGDEMCASVRSDEPIPLASIPDVMGEIRRLNPEAPLRIGDVLLENPCGVKARIIVTRDVNRVR